MKHEIPHTELTIPDVLFVQYSARLLEIEKGGVIFEEGEKADSFHSVQNGEIKMVHINEQGREFVHGYFTAGQSFGEPPFFCNTRYPSAAIAIEDSRIWKFSRPSKKPRKPRR